MARFKRKTSYSTAISTSSLPDIIFMLLFFFMVTTRFRQSDLLVKNSLPTAANLNKLEKKSLVSYIFIGAPRKELQSKFGAEPRIQVNDVLVTPDQIPQYVMEQKDKLGEEGDKITMSLKIDRDAKMGIVVDVREQLREANALKVNYAAGGEMREQQ